MDPIRLFNERVFRQASACAYLSSRPRSLWQGRKTSPSPRFGTTGPHTYSLPAPCVTASSTRMIKLRSPLRDPRTHNELGRSLYVDLFKCQYLIIPITECENQASGRLQQGGMLHLLEHPADTRHPSSLIRRVLARRVLRCWGRCKAGFALGFKFRRFHRVACLSIVSGKRKVERAILFAVTQCGLEQRNGFPNSARLAETVRDSQNGFGIRMVCDPCVFV